MGERLETYVIKGEKEGSGMGWLKWPCCSEKCKLVIYYYHRIWIHGFWKRQSHIQPAFDIS